MTSSQAAVLPLLSLLLLGAVSLRAQHPPLVSDRELDSQLQSIASAHHGKVAVFAQNLSTGQTAEVDADVPVKTASVIKMGILLDAAEQIRGGKASFEDKLVLTKENQVPGSGVLGQHSSSS